MPEEIAIRVENVSKNFILPHEKISSVKGAFTNITKKRTKHSKEVQHALKDISFEIKKGEFFGIVGRNGSGKSTLLKILAGIYQPTSGKVSTAGKLVPFIELGVGFNPELTGRENVYLNGAMLGFSEKEVSKMYKDIVEFAELEKFMDQKLKNYSSGMQVRLAFSMATRSEADILLIDEVLAVGDADFQRKCFDYFKKLKKDHKTVVFVSHDMEAIRQFCNSAALIENNGVEDIGSTARIAEQYQKLFLKGKENDKTLNSLNTSGRLGTGLVQIVATSLNKGIFTDKDQDIELAVVLNALKENQQLMTGFAVKDAEGRYINGSHTWTIQDDLNLSPGDTCKVNWTFQNAYEDGLYTVDVYAYGRDHEVFDKLDDAISFRVKRPAKTGCIVTLPVKVSLNDSKKQQVG